MSDIDENDVMRLAKAAIREELEAHQGEIDRKVRELVQERLKDVAGRMEREVGTWGCPDGYQTAYKAFIAIIREM